MLCLLRPFQANTTTHNIVLLSSTLTECFLVTFSLFDHNQPNWEGSAKKEVNTYTHTYTGSSVKDSIFLSGKCISSCQHFCSLLDWALCSAVTPLQEASSSSNSRAIFPGSRLATGVPTHPCLSLPLGCRSCCESLD